MLPTDFHLIVDFVLANLAAEGVKYLGDKLFQVIDKRYNTFLDVD